jgi:ethanolamine utilization protein EutA
MGHDHHHPEDLEEHSEGGEIDPNANLAPNPGWLILNSVGIDVGSTTSHVTFSKLFLERQGLNLSSRFVVVRRDVLYRTPILLTPYQDSETIDTERLSAFITRGYRDAGLQPSQIDTGAVICTGEAVKKKNSEAITRMFSTMGGKFVCATAGPRLEGILSAHGSGAMARAKTDRTVLNVDVGGGTCKTTFLRKGAVLETGAINVGARLIAWDLQDNLRRIEQTGRKVAQTIGVRLELGMTLSQEDKRLFAQTLANALFEFLRRGSLSPLTTELLLTGPLNYKGPIDEIIFSGGVAEYIYDHDQCGYGDLGPLLAEEIRTRLPSLGISLREGVERIRATVIGASQYTVQVSSSTIYLSNPGNLPLQDYQVIVPRLEPDHLTREGVARSIHQAMERLDASEGEFQHPIAVFFHWPFEFSYSSVLALAAGIASALASKTSDDPWVLVLDSDIGGLLGTLLKQELEVKSDVVIVDEVELRDLDFIDIGQELKNRGAVPVVVKSLVFG